jgi:hypothetical protein
MKRNICVPIAAALLFISAMLACKKSMDVIDPVTNNNNSSHPTDSSVTTPPVAENTFVPYPQHVSTRCSGAPRYGDSIIFVQPASVDYIIKPVNNPDSGHYFAWPVGMVIDINTGAINLSKSEGGLRYNIGWVKKGTTDTCLQSLILAGASYMDSIYVLNDNQRYAKPYFNADPKNSSICSGSGVSGGSKCVFDVNKLAEAKKVVVDHNTGIINLKESMNKGLFGVAPFDGQSVLVPMQYQLNDNSNLALQQITINFIFYNKRSDVPADLLSAVVDKLDKITNQLLLINLLPSADKQINKGNPRPPIIIVTRYAF